jgi:hypothetical protein
MKRSLTSRIAALEESHQQAIRASNNFARSGGGSAIEEIQQYLRDRRIEQAGTESLAETFARALGIGSEELKARLHETAFGHAGSW